eukprot:11333508-Alexandrium_andersonii.AAC.1
MHVLMVAAVCFLAARSVLQELTDGTGPRTCSPHRLDRICRVEGSIGGLMRTFFALEPASGGGLLPASGLFPQSQAVATPGHAGR